MPSRSVSHFMLGLALVFGLLFLLLQPLTLENDNFFTYLALSTVILGVGTLLVGLSGSSSFDYRAAVAVILLAVSIFGANALLHPGCQNTGQGYWSYTNPVLQDFVLTLRSTGYGDYSGGHSWNLDSRGLPATLIDVFYDTPSFDISVSTSAPLHGTVYLEMGLIEFGGIGSFYQRNVTFNASSKSAINVGTGYIVVASWGDCRTRLEGQNVLFMVGLDLQGNEYPYPPLNFTIHPVGFNSFSSPISIHEFVEDSSFQNDLIIFALGAYVAINAYIPSEYIAGYLKNRSSSKKKP